MVRQLRRSRWLAGWLLAAAIASGCASHRTLSSAREEETKGHWDLAVLEYSKALALDPENPNIKMAYERARFSAASDHFRKGKVYRASGQLELALIELQMAVALDPTNSYAKTEYDRAKKEKDEIDRLGRQLTPIERLKEEAKGARIQPPMLSAKSQEPITLSFPKETSVKDIYKALGAAAGINILFDPQLKDDKITVDLKDVSFQRGLEIVMRQATHFYKVLDETTIIVAADNPQNRKDYEDLVIKTFFLSSGDVKEVMNVLRTLIEARRIAMNQQLNAIVIRDTIDKVAVAERIIESNDKAKAEVVIDVELLQVNSTKVRELGVDLTSTNISQTLAPQNLGENEGLRWNDLLNLSVGDWVFSGIPGFTYSFLKNNGEASLLAKPQLRITEGEKATLTIGDRVPIPTTTFNTTGTVGTNVIPITSFQYQDVGIKIDIEPRVHHNREVTLKLTVEVSQLGESVKFGQGQEQPRIGTRTITSVIRLMDGESNFLAGLIRTDKQESHSGVPFLMDLPVLGRLFSSEKEQVLRTDLLLTLTPHIVRMPDITEEDLLPIWVGTENNVTFQGTTQRIESNVPNTPFDEERPLTQPEGGSVRRPGGAGQPQPLSPQRGGFGLGGRKPGGGLGGGAGDGQPPGPKAVEEEGQPDETIAPDAPKKAMSVVIDVPTEAAAPALRLLAPAEVSVGSEFEVRVLFDDATELAAFEASMIYDSLVLEVLGVATSPSVEAPGSGMSADRIPGVVRFAWRQAPAAPLVAAPVEATIRLRGLRPGAVSLLWSGGIGQGADGRPRAVSLLPATVNLVARAFEPTPAEE